MYYICEYMDLQCFKYIRSNINMLNYVALLFPIIDILLSQYIIEYYVIIIFTERSIIYRYRVRSLIWIRFQNHNSRNINLRPCVLLAYIFCQ